MIEVLDWFASDTIRVIAALGVLYFVCECIAIPIKAARRGK